MNRVYVSKAMIVRPHGYMDERYLLWEEGKFDRPIANLLKPQLEQLGADIAEALKLPTPKLPKR